MSHRHFSGPARGVKKMQNTCSSVTETVTEEDIFGKDVPASEAEAVATIIIDFKYILQRC
jgi:hypothetical protein